jgi:hypothetical protein
MAAKKDSANAALIEGGTQSGVVTAGVKEFTLPSGTQVSMRRGNGHDIIRASRIVDMQKDGPMSLILAMASVKCTFNGHPLTYEDLLELDDEDCWALIGQTQSGKGQSPPITLHS